jgi:vacuolar-type H+-ATPase subunit F/Vma7
MSVPVFIGDELTGAGFRLAGLRIFEAQPGEVESLFRQALEQAPLVIITAKASTGVPRDLLEDAVSRAQPPVTIVPEAVAGPPLPDIEREVRAALGVES